MGTEALLWDWLWLTGTPKDGVNGADGEAPMGNGDTGFL